MFSIVKNKVFVHKITDYQIEELACPLGEDTVAKR